MLNEGIRPLQGRRNYIYGMALQWIAQHPTWGIGAQGFGDLYHRHVLETMGPSSALVITHSHSLLLEFTLSHGLPALLILVGVIGSTLLRCGKTWWHGTLNSSDQSWWMAGLLISWLHIWDVPFFDSRLNIAGWLIFAAISAIATDHQPRQNASDH
jgi:O-antigen ligase